MISPDTLVRDLVVQHPQTLRVFEKHSIDYCCGGGTPLSAAASKTGVDLDQLVADLEQAVSQPPTEDDGERDWSQASLTELIEFIVATHHAFMKTETPRLEHLLATVIGAHGERHGDVLHPLAGLYQTVKTDVEAHLKREEEQVFPAIARSESTTPDPGGNDLAALVNTTVSEHEALGQVLHDIRKLTANFALPNDACPTFAALYDGLQGIERDLHRHIHLENNLLFPRALKTSKA